VRDVLPASVGFSLRVFGHKEADSCRTDLEMPAGPLDRAAAALGALSPVLAGAAMALSSASVVSNALLLRRWRPPHAAPSAAVRLEAQTDEGRALRGLGT